MYPGTHAATTPHKAAIIMAESGATVSYRELDERSNQLAQWLYDNGLRAGDHVAILAENHLRYFEVHWAAMRSGLYLTTINRYLSADEAAYLVNDSGASVLITSIAMAETAAQLVDMTPHCQFRLMFDDTIEGYESYEAALLTQPTSPLDHQPAGDAMLYSSGTTGRPKGIKRPLSGITIDDPSRSGTSTLERYLFGMDETSIYLSPAPLYHSAPLLWGAGVHELGGTLVIMEQFEPAAFLQFIEQYNVTATQVVPTMFIRLLKLPAESREQHDLSSLTMCVHAAAPCPIPVKSQMIEWWGPIINEYYGGTEGIGLTFINSADWLEHRGSVGKPILGIPHVCDDTGVELDVGETGIVYFEREGLTFEYHNDAEKTANSRHPHHDDWAKFGDIGYLDEDGFLYLTDRASFMIISGGVNIYPQEIEACFALHPKVADIAVFGLPDPEMGEYVHAVVQLEPGNVIDQELVDELRAFARTEIAHYKVPRTIDFRDKLPRLPTGKLYKKPLRQEYLDAQPNL